MQPDWSLDQGLPEAVDEAVKGGNLDIVQEFYESYGRRPEILGAIASAATENAQIEILDWAFDNDLQILNEYEFYDTATLASSIPVWETLVRHGYNFTKYHSEYLGDALSLAAFNGQIDIVRFLLENGQDPNEAWGYNDSQISVLPLDGMNEPSIQLLQLLLEYGLKSQETAAHIAAAELGNMEALRILVHHGANLEFVDAWWFNPAIVESDRQGTALYRAAYKGQVESVKYLLGKGASLQFKDRGGRSILQVAKEGGNKEVISMLEVALRGV